MNMHCIPPSIMVSNLDADAFLKALAPGETEFTFQTFTDAKPKPKPDPLARTLPGGIDALAGKLAALNARGAGVYVTVNATNGRGRKARNIKAIRAVFQEDDDG